MKRQRQALTRHRRNVRVKTAVKDDVRAVTDAISSGDSAAAGEAFRAAVSEIDRAVKKGALHSGTAARRKSRLNQQLRQIVAGSTKPATKPKAATKTKSAKPTVKPAA